MSISVKTDKIDQKIDRYSNEKQVKVIVNMGTFINYDRQGVVNDLCDKFINWKSLQDQFCSRGSWNTCSRVTHVADRSVTGFATNSSSFYVNLTLQLVMDILRYTNCGLVGLLRLKDHIRLISILHLQKEVRIYLVIKKRWS